MRLDSGGAGVTGVSLNGQARGNSRIGSAHERRGCRGPSPHDTSGRPGARGGRECRRRVRGSDLRGRRLRELPDKPGSRWVHARPPGTRPLDASRRLLRLGARARAQTLESGGDGGDRRRVRRQQDDPAVPDRAGHGRSSRSRRRPRSRPPRVRTAAVEGAPRTCDRARPQRHRAVPATGTHARAPRPDHPPLGRGPPRLQLSRAAPASSPATPCGSRTWPTPSRRSAVAAPPRSTRASAPARSSRRFETAAAI